MERKIRKALPSDGPELIGLWHRVFGDPPELAAAFWRLLPELGAGLAAEKDGQLVGAAYLVTAMDFVRADGSALRCGYLYALGVEESARRLGIGRELSQAAAALGREQGAELLCTLPANEGLYPWYEKLLGLRCALYRTRERISAAPGLSVRPLDFAEYNARREQLLQGRPHVRFSDAAMRYEQLNCELFGGGLFAVGNGIAAVYENDAGIKLLRELLGAAPEQAAAVGDYFGVPHIDLMLPAPEGLPYLAAEPGLLPPDTVWNLAFD